MKTQTKPKDTQAIQMVPVGQLRQHPQNPRKDLDAEEKAVIDSFEGEESYNRVMARPDYFLTDASQMLRLEAGA